MARGENLVVLKAKNFSKTGDIMPTKIGLHAFWVNFYLHEFFEPILFFDFHGLPWSEGKIWPFLKANKKEPNLRNWRGHAHQIWFVRKDN